MPIRNRDRFPDVDFLANAEIRAIGEVEGITLVLVGKEQGSDAPVVARAYTDNFTSEDLHAVPLYELMAHTFGSINILEKL
ncbi:MAG: hypothetical protein HC781_06445 [Leptolyngbyaceae cyanobacterium CSU_1_4]|nr:hypothetical protein [Leptolyngbyaceae cyanobacterium CSU_1_4]